MDLSSKMTGIKVFSTFNSDNPIIGSITKSIAEEGEQENLSTDAYESVDNPYGRCVFGLVGNAEKHSFMLVMSYLNRAGKKMQLQRGPIRNI
ncbi:hypothetical protein GCM10027454_21610 [Algoriphagus aestuariicola]